MVQRHERPSRQSHARAMDRARPTTRDEDWTLNWDEKLTE